MNKRLISVFLGCLALGAVAGYPEGADAWVDKVHASACFASSGTLRDQDMGIKNTYTGDGILVCPATDRTDMTKESSNLVEVWGNVNIAGSVVATMPCVANYNGNYGACNALWTSTNTVGLKSVAFTGLGSGLWSTYSWGVPYMYVKLSPGSRLSGIIYRGT